MMSFSLMGPWPGLRSLIVNARAGSSPSNTNVTVAGPPNGEYTGSVGTSTTAP